MLSSKKTFLFFIAATLCMATMAVLRGQSQQDMISNKNEEMTLVQEGVMTGSQREHSKLYDNRVRGRKKLGDIKQSVNIIIPVPWFEPAEENTPTATSIEDILQAEACRADVVVLGVVKSKASQITEDGYAIFTDYEVDVEEVLKGSSDTKVQPNGKIVVTRPGGAVKLNGNVIRMIDKSFQPLETGERYLLFLRFIPSTGAYQWVSEESSFEIKTNKVSRQTERRLPFIFTYEDKPAAFIDQIRAVVSKCGNEQTGGDK